MPRSRAPLALALVTAAVAHPSREAYAFCRTTTVSVPADFQPRADACWTQGNPLFWKNACVGYSIQKDASRQVSYDDASLAITRAFTKWTNATCVTDGTGGSRVSIDVRDLGPSDCNVVQYNQDYPNQHLIVFRDDTWPHNDVNNTLALTTVTFNPDTGEIYDADMEVNTFQQRVTLVDPIPSDGYDFASIVTHETGHFLGLAHSGDPHATMFAHYQPGSTAMRNLTADDVLGICTVYRPDGQRTMRDPGSTMPEDACDPTPRHGFTTSCAPSVKKGCNGNAVAPTQGRGDGAAWLAAGLAFAALRRRRRK
jgi:MYXO-CTERM domain-containing protein